MAKVLIEDAVRGSHFKLRPDQCTIVGLDTDDGAEHPLWDKRIRLPIDPGMVASIKARGVVQPIRVAVEDGVYYVVAGRQRVRHARIAVEQGTEVLIPAIAEKMGDVERHAEIATMENAIRRDDSVLEKASEAQRALDREVPIAQVAVRFGVTVATIQNWTSLLGLAAPVKKAIEAGVVAPTAAAKWASLPKADQVAALELAAQATPGKRVSVKGAERIANPNAVVRPSKKALLALVEAAPESDFARGIRVALGMEAMPEAEVRNAAE
jgi:ParB/RepB/Spo0J family partition protein